MSAVRLVSSVVSVSASGHDVMIWVLEYYKHNSLCLLNFYNTWSLLGSHMRNVILFLTFSTTERSTES